MLMLVDSIRYAFISNHSVQILLDSHEAASGSSYTLMSTYIYSPSFYIYLHLRSLYSELLNSHSPNA